MYNHNSNNMKNILLQGLTRSEPEEKLNGRLTAYFYTAGTINKYKITWINIFSSNNYGMFTIEPASPSLITRRPPICVKFAPLPGNSPGPTGAVQLYTL